MSVVPKEKEPFIEEIDWLPKETDSEADPLNEALLMEKPIASEAASAVKEEANCFFPSSGGNHGSLRRQSHRILGSGLAAGQSQREYQSY
jgi:hypothetical protein